MNVFHLVKDGVLQIPLYHGTSSIWLRSIEEYGLGAVNPVDQYQVIPVLRALFETADERLADSVEWQSKRMVLESMIKQEVTAGNMNFRHGAVYLTPSRSTASRYAAPNQFGSEIISQCISLLRLLQESRVVLSPELQGMLSPLEELVSGPTCPILLEVRSVPVVLLRGETGDDGSNNLDEIQRVIDDCLARREIIRKAGEGDVEAFCKVLEDPIKPKDHKPLEDLIKQRIELYCQQENFELLGSIPAQQITVHHLSDLQEED